MTRSWQIYADNAVLSANDFQAVSIRQQIATDVQQPCPRHDVILWVGFARHTLH
jgi:hypothetical protein